MTKKWYPTINEKRKKNLVRRNRKLQRKMKSIDGLMEHFQEQLPKRVNERS